MPGLAFKAAARLPDFFGTAVPEHIATVATGFYASPRFQTHDPDGDGPFADLPVAPSFASCAASGSCETTDERFTRDASGTPVVIDVPPIPFTVVVPSGTPPAAGWPVIIQQHALGGDRASVVAFGEADAARGFASIGIDAVQHGYRYWNCGAAAACPQDTRNAFGGTAVPDGFADDPNTGFLSVNLGFFQAFHNFLGIRDNFRQTYADLLSLVRLLHGHTIDTALDAKLDDTRIFYMGHSLGGLIGSGFVPIEPDVTAALLNATGGGLTSQLFVNSSIGAGAIGLVEGILGLDPANAFDQFAFAANLTQTIIDPADGINSARLLLAPVDGAPRNVVQVEDFGDQVVPNQANEALAVASNLPIFDPFVQNLHQNPLALPIANLATPHTLHGNAAGGMATAALVQNGPATHAASLFFGVGTLTFVPEFAHIDEFVVTGQAFPTLERAIRVQNLGIFDAVVDSLAELAVAGIAPGSSAERDLVLATFNPGTCMMGGAPCAENGDCGANGPCVGTSYTPFVDTAIDTAAHAARAAGVTHFSTFAVLPATLFSTLVRGGGPRRSDCRAEWQVVNPTNTPFRDAQGEVSGLQTCRDGDATCDGDGAADGACTFRLAVCPHPGAQA